MPQVVNRFHDSGAMFRITKTNHEVCRVLKLEGKLLHPWIDDLVREFRAARAHGYSVELDMSGVSYVDDPCLIVLSDLVRQGIAIKTPSPFISELLKVNKS